MTFLIMRKKLIGHFSTNHMDAYEIYLICSWIFFLDRYFVEYKGSFILFFEAQKQVCTKCYSSVNVVVVTAL